MTSGPTRILLLRHGQSTWNAEGRWQGHADPPLSPLGERQARDAASHLSALGLGAVVASDLQRAYRTAELIAAELDLGPVELEPRLRERDVGLFSGHTHEELYELFPECFDANGRAIRLPEGEPDDALTERATAALRAVAERQPGETVLVLSHGGVIRLLERRLGIQPPALTPNLAGRWFIVDAETGDIRGGDPVVPIDEELETAPPSR